MLCLKGVKDMLLVPEYLSMNWLPTGAVSKQYKMILVKIMACTSIVLQIVEAV